MKPPRTAFLVIMAGHFVAACDLLEQDGVMVVHNAAPILNYMNGWTESAVREYCKRKKWAVQ